MQNYKTTLSGLGMCLVALVYVGLKLAHGKPITDEDLTILGLGVGGGVKGWFSADKTPTEAPKP